MGSSQRASGLSNIEMMSYIINQMPELKAEIGLPKASDKIAPIGKIIMNNERYKNDFLNVVNIIGLTFIDRNTWDDSAWKVFTEKGSLAYGQQIREIIADIANVYDYNQELLREDGFIKTEVPNVYEYIHDLNFQKFYKTTTSDEQMAMAFNNEDLFYLIDIVINSLYEALKYDKFQVNKYMLARRVLDGTVTAVQIPNFASLTDRDVVAFIKNYSNKMTFRSPNYNPAGIRKATAFEDQFAIVSTEFDSKFTTNVLSTSYFRSNAEVKALLALTDGFGEFDMPRLAELFAKRDANGDVIPNEYIDGYVPFTTAELNALKEIPCAIIGRDFYQNRNYAIDNSSGEKVTEFYNPQTLKRNHFLHYWGVMSTSPFENAIVFTQTAQGVSEVAISPSSATMGNGSSLQLSANVTTTGFANKAVAWSSSSTSVKVDEKGVVKVPSDYDNTGTGTAGVTTITITTALAEGDTIKVNDVTYTVAAADDTAAKQGAALRSALNVTGITTDYTIGGSGANATLTEASGKYGLVGAPTIVVTSENGKVTETTTAGALAGNHVVITATSVYDNTKSGTALITIS